MPFNGKIYPWEAPNNKGHVWQTDEDGDVEIFAYNPSEYHNGPLCINCGYGFCHHCEELPEIECSAESESESHG